MDEKCEIASKVVDYVWYCLMKKEEVHSFIDQDGTEHYIDEAQDIFNRIIDLIDDESDDYVISEKDIVRDNNGDEVETEG